jgi:hypothetical protein
MMAVWLDGQREQVRMMYWLAERTAELWRGGWTVRAPERPSVKKRMAALSLRVVEGGRNRT